MRLVLDSSSLIAYLENEDGADVVDSLLQSSEDRFIHAVNLCEVFYGAYRGYGEEKAQASVDAILNMGIIVREDMDEAFWQEAGRVKAVLRRISLADCYCATLANRIGAEVVTADHKEFEPLVERGWCKVKFIR